MRSAPRQHDADVALWIDAVEPVGDHLSHGAAQFGRNFRAGCAGPDDRHVKLAGNVPDHPAFARECRHSPGGD